MTRQHYEAMRAKQGALLVGSPEQVIEKILYQYGLFRHDRYLAQMTVGTMPHKEVMRSIELFGTKVAPVIKKEIAAKENKS
jgi:alkanesulfonate monooxygenase SsuD/methylene tetrahydromethanopterin reductase-like flavin-dependent oxidoreductase (luciferase family)